jgi:hypothetical protein
LRAASMAGDGGVGTGLGVCSDTWWPLSDRALDHRGRLD